MLGTKRKRLSYVQGAHRILSWVGRRQITGSMFTGGHSGGDRILLGRSLHRKGIFSEEEQRAGGQWVEGEIGW